MNTPAHIQVTPLRRTATVLGRAPARRSCKERGTLFLDTQGRRISTDDSLEDGEAISFMGGIAGG